MNRPTVRNIKKAKAIFGLITAVFSLAIAIQQIYHIREGDMRQA